MCKQDSYQLGLNHNTEMFLKTKQGRHQTVVKPRKGNQGGHHPIFKGITCGPGNAYETCHLRKDPFDLKCSWLAAAFQSLFDFYYATFSSFFLDTKDSLSKHNERKNLLILFSLRGTVADREEAWDCSVVSASKHIPTYMLAPCRSSTHAHNDQSFSLEVLRARLILPPELIFVRI